MNITMKQATDPANLKQIQKEIKKDINFFSSLSTESFHWESMLLILSPLTDSDTGVLL